MSPRIAKKGLPKNQALTPPSLSFASNSQKDIESIVRAQIHANPVLTREEERALLKAWHENIDYEARNKLIMSHLKCVWGIARRFKRDGIAMSDLVYEGILGLVLACDKFNPDMPNRFATYAQWWVMTTLQEYIEHSVAPVKMGKTRVEKMAFSLINKARRRYGSPLTLDMREAIANQLEIPFGEFIRIESTMALKSLSLNQTVGGEDDGMEFIDVIVDESTGAEHMFEKSLEASRSRHIKEALARLDMRQQTVINKRFFCDPQATLKDLAEELSISPERVRQIQMEATRELRRIMEGYGMSALDFFDAGV